MDGLIYTLVSYFLAMEGGLFCNECGKNVNNQKKYRKHQRYHDENELKCNECDGTPMHQYRSMKMLTIHNSLRLGNVKPMKRKRRKKNSSSPTSFSSTASPLATTSFPSTPSPLATTRSKQSPFSHVFMQRYPESVALHYKDK